MFHSLGFALSNLNSATFTTIPAVADDEFTRSNNGFFLTEDYNMISAFAFGQTLRAVRLNVPTINQYARPHIFSMNGAAADTIPANPQVHDMRSYPVRLPKYEAIVAEANNTAGGAQETSIHIAIAPPGWTKNLPQGEQRLILRATASATTGTQTWGSVGSLTFDENLKSGWYSVVGAQCFEAGSLLFRLVFSKPFMNAGRKMRPGGICLQAAENMPYYEQLGGFGEWGRFHSTEPPQLQVFDITTGAGSQVVWLDVVYLGNNPP